MSGTCPIRPYIHCSPLNDLPLSPMVRLLIIFKCRLRLHVRLQKKMGNNVCELFRKKSAGNKKRAGDAITWCRLSLDTAVSGEDSENKRKPGADRHKGSANLRFPMCKTCRCRNHGPNIPIPYYSTAAIAEECEIDYYVVFPRRKTAMKIKHRMT